MKQGKARPLDDKFMKDEIDSSALRELTVEKSQLESDLEVCGACTDVEAFSGK